MRFLVKFVTVAVLVSSAQSAFAYDCNSDCREVGHYHYPCPNWDNLKKLCLGQDPIEVDACSVQQAVSCDLWQRAGAVVGPKVKAYMSRRFNHHTWEQAVISSGEDAYMEECVASGVAICGALGAEVQAPWGAVIGGAAGAFVSHRLCEQSRSW